jgi:HKD family nuclease
VFWKVRGLWEGFQKEWRFLYREEENALLKCVETRKLIQECLCNKYLSIEEDLAYRRVINCTNVWDLKMLENTNAKLHGNRLLKLVTHNWK